jgi:hypothetical protein
MDKDWKGISDDSRTLPGPKAFFISGYGPEQLAAVRTFPDSLNYRDIPLRPCTEPQINGTLEEALSAESPDEPLGQGKLPHVLILSGLTFSDVQNIMKNFNGCPVPRPIFGTTTPSNLPFTVKELLLHLLEEQKAAREAAEKGKN